jgi:ferredoxin--NADP+ reductase
MFQRLLRKWQALSQAITLTEDHDMRLQEYDTSTRFIAHVTDNQRLSCPSPEAAGGGGSDEEVRELVLEIEDTDLNLGVGQSIGVIVPGNEVFGQTEHFRLYSVAETPEKIADGSVRLRICVRRCHYIDPYNGEEYQGIASHYLCDLKVGDPVVITGPFGDAFRVPDEPDATLILIGAGTGIAPFRAFVKHLYRDEPRFRGRVRLFHGGRTGVDLLYRNDIRDDFAQYYDRDTFEAIEALSKRPQWTDEIDWATALEPHGEELLKVIMEPNTYVYVAGLEPIGKQLDGVFAKICGSADTWARRKAELVAGDRWVELLY